MSESLRDQLEKAFDEHVEETGAQAPQGVDTTPSTETHAEPAQPAEQKGVGRTAGRARDEHGRLLPGPAKRETAAAQEKAPPAQSTAQATQTAPAAEPKKINRPSSWKKDHWDAFDQLASTNPALAEYINQRENEYAKGVSTYKGEWEKAKPLLEAVAPFQQTLQQYGIDPAVHVQRLFNAHQQLALGSPQQKLAMFSQLVKDYQIPIDQLFVQGQDGRLYANPNIPAVQQQPQQQQKQQDPRAIVRAVLEEERAASEVQEMAADAQKYPHLEQVKETMVGLLQIGKAQDLKDAYAKAIRLHDDIWQAEQENARKAEETARAQASRKQVTAARANAVSVKSATPTAPSAEGKKGLRATLEEAYDQHTAGRV